MPTKQILLLLAALTALLCLPARADTTVFGSLTPVTNTTVYSSVIQTNTISFTTGRFLVSNGGMLNTNAFAGVRQFSVDGINFTNIGSTYRPSGTNAATETVPQAIISIPIYFRMSATTTGAVSVGVVYLSP